MHKENNKHVQYNRTNRRAHEVVYNDKIMTIGFRNAQSKAPYPNEHTD